MSAQRRSFSSYSSTRIKKIEKGLAYFLQLVAICYFIFFFGRWLTERYHIRFHEVTVTGIHASDPSTTRAVIEDALKKKYFHWLLRDNAVLFPQNEIRSQIQKANGWVDTVNFEPHATSLEVHVVERTPHYVWCGGITSASTTVTDGTCFFADHAGYIYAPAPTYSGYPFLRIVSDVGNTIDQPYGTSTLPSREFTSVVRFIKELENEGYTALVVEQIGPHDYRFHLDTPWKLIWESDQSPSQSLLRLRAAIEAIKADKTKGINQVNEIDLRFGEKIFYR